MKELVIVRHAESQANRDGVWNGRSDGPLSDDGEAQLEKLGRRLSPVPFDYVVSSPLERARLTAASFSDEVEVNEDLIELDLGKWDGLSTEEVQALDGAALKEAVTDRSLPFGTTGESLDESGKRITAALEGIVERMADDTTAAVVTHGGLLQTFLHRFLPGDGRRVHSFVDNTSITRVKFYRGQPRLAVFNDTGHLGPRSKQVEATLAGGEPILTLVRHGRTRANVEQRWQGQRDWDLDELGYRQAEALSSHYGQWANVFSSPLRRAHNTAKHLALGDPVIVDDLMELNMGKWEDLTADEIAEQWPGVLEQIYEQGHDLPRGETGETWSQLTKRFSGAVTGIPVAKGEPTVVVAHGGAIRSYVSSLTATVDTYSESLFTPANTSVTHVAITERGPLILDYSVAPHLEELEG